MHSPMKRQGSHWIGRPCVSWGVLSGGWNVPRSPLENIHSFVDLEHKFGIGVIGISVKPFGWWMQTVSDKSAWMKAAVMPAWADLRPRKNEKIIIRQTVCNWIISQSLIFAINLSTKYGFELIDSAIWIPFTLEYPGGRLNIHGIFVSYKSPAMEPFL